MSGFSSQISRRSILAGVSAMILAPAALVSSPVAAQTNSAYSFRTEGGEIVLSDVNLKVSRHSDGFKATLTINPTYEEREALLRVLSHVNFFFSFSDVYPTWDDPSRVIVISDYIRRIHRTDEDMDEGEAYINAVDDPTIAAMGFNLKRWETRPLKITIILKGYASYSDGLPGVDVVMESAEWKPADGSCTPEEGYENNAGDDVCMRTVDASYFLVPWE